MLFAVVNRSLLFLGVVTALPGQNTGRTSAAPHVLRSPKPAFTIPDVDPNGKWLFPTYMRANVQVAEDGTIAVAGDASLTLFSSAGKFLEVVGRKGDGPGEFQSIGSFVSCGGGRWLVGDWKQLRASEVGGKAAPIDLSRTVVGLPSAGSPVLCYPGIKGFITYFLTLFPAITQRSTAVQDTAFLYTWTGTGQAVRTSIAAPSGKVVKGFSLPYAPRALFTVQGQAIAFGTSDDSILRLIPAPGAAPVRVPVRGLPRIPISKALRDSAVSSYKALSQPQNWEMQAAALAAMSWPSFAPFWSNVLFDDQGRLWVKEGTDRVHEPFDYIPQSRWRLVDRKGNLLGVLDLARGEKLVGFSKGMMLLARVLPDDTDVLEGYTYVIR